MKRKKALVVIDMLRDFLESGGALYCGGSAREIIPFVAGKIALFRKNKDLVIYARDSHGPDSPQFKLFKKHCVKNSSGAQIIRELKPQKNDWIVPKTTYDAAFDSSLLGILKKNRVKEVFLAGVCTSICVMETASSLTKRGYKVRVFKKGVADFEKKAHTFALKRMKAVYGAGIV